MNVADELLVKLLNLWYYNEPLEYNVSEGMKRFAIDIIKMAQYGDDKIYSHPKIFEIVQLLKDFGIFEYHKSLMELYFEGRMRLQMEIREMFNDPAVYDTLQALANVLGKMAKQITKEAKKQIEKEKNASAIPYLANKRIFEN